MPLVLEIRCPACDWKEGHAQTLCVARDEDGAEVVLPHPGEHRALARLAGVSENEAYAVWTRWSAQGRLYTKTATICVACGARGSAPQPSRAQCMECGARSLQPMVRQDGCTIPMVLGAATMVGGLWLGWIVGLTLGAALAIAIGAEVHQERRHKRRIAALPCPSCGSPGLKVHTIGKS